MQGENGRGPSADPKEELFPPGICPDPSSLWDEPLGGHVHKERRLEVRTGNSWLRCVVLSAAEPPP